MKIKNEMVTILIHFIKHNFSVIHEMKKVNNFVIIKWSGLRTLSLLIVHEGFLSTDFHNLQG